MKIIVTTDHPGLTTGYGIIGYNIAKHWHEQGHEIVYIAWQAGGLDTAIDQTFPYKILRCDPLRDRYGLGIFNQQCEEFRPDLVWSTGDIWMCYHTAIYEAADSFKSIWYAPIDSEGMLDQVKTGPHYMAEYIDVKSSLERFSLIVGQTKFACNVINTQLGKEKSSDFIYPGYDAENIYPLPEEKRKEFRKILTGKEDSYLVSFISRNGMRKNPLGAMEGFLKAEIPNSYMYMHCPLLEDMGYDLKKAVGLFKADSKIILSDIPPGKGLSRSVINRIYNASHIHLLPSSREGFGMTYLEAAAAGIPSIYTDANCAKEFGPMIGRGVQPVAKTWDIWTHSINQIVSADDIAKELKWLYEHPEEAANFSKSGVQFASEHTWEKFCSHWDEIVEKKIDVRTNRAFVSPHDKRKNSYEKIVPKKEKSVALVTTWNERCGIARYSKNLAKNLSIKPTILAADTSEFDQDYHVIRCWRRKRDNLRALNSVLKSIRPTVVHFQMDWAFIIENFAAYVPFVNHLQDCGIKVIFTYHTVPKSSEDPIGRWYATRMDELLRYSLGIFHSETHAKIVEEINPDLRSKSYVIEHGIELYNGTEDKEKEFTFVSSGFAHLSKGFQYCIKASKMLDLPHKLIIQSSAHPLDPTQGDYLKMLRDRIGDAKNIEILDTYLADQEVCAMFRKAHCGIFMYETLPSQGCSGSAATCVGAGTPVIVSDCPAFHGLQGFPITSLSAENIASEMRKMITDHNHRTKLTEHAHSLREKLSWKNAAIRHEEIYYS